MSDRDRFADVLESAWLEHAAAKTVDSPRGHCERLADALVAAGASIPAKETE